MRIQVIDNIVIIGSLSMKEFAISLQIINTLKTHNDQLHITWVGSQEQQPLIEYIEGVNAFYSSDEITDTTFSNSQVVLFLSEHKELAKRCRDLKIETRIGAKGNWRSNRRFTDTVDISQFDNLLDCYYALLSPLDIVPSKVNSPVIIPPIRTFRGIIKKDLKNIVFYPYRSDTHRVWPAIRYFELIDQLPKYENNYIIAGMELEGKALQMTAPELFRVPSVKDATDLEDLEEVIALIAKGDLLITYNNDIAHFAHAIGAKVICISSASEAFYVNKAMQMISTPDASCIKCVGDKPCECLRKLGVDEVIQNIKNNTSI